MAKDKEFEKEYKRIRRERTKIRKELRRCKKVPRRCKHCRKQSGEWRVDPYYEEMYGIKYEGYICDDCYNSSLGDI